MLLSTLRLSAALDPEQRVIGDVQAEHLLLGPQTVALVELDVGDRRALVEACSLRGSLVPVAEQAHHAAVTLTPAFERDVDDLLEGSEQPAPGVAEAVEGAGLDQRLDRALVEHWFGDTLGELVERRELAVRVALGDEQVDEGLADVAHRREPERDRARAADRQRDVGRHTIGGRARRSRRPIG